jgi:hypothetical protein
MEVGHVITALFAMAVLVGVVTMVLGNPAQTNALVSAGTTGITGLIKGNEGLS